METNSTKVNISTQEIMKLLPHRYPFLLLDRVVGFKMGEFVEAIKCVSINEPFFQGHFPGLPVMPGVLMLESLAQAGGVLIAKSLTEDELKNKILLFSGLENVKFRSPVFPGSQLLIRVDFERKRLNLWRMKGVGSVEGKVVVSATLTAAFVDRSEV